MSALFQGIPLKASINEIQEDQQFAVASEHLFSIFPLEDQASREEDRAACACKVPINVLPLEILELIFIQFDDVQSLGRVAQVSKHWKEIADNNSVWKHLLNSLPGLSIFKDPNDEASTAKEKVQHHFLRVLVNSEGSLARVQDLVAKYHLTSFFGERLKNLLKRVACSSLLETLVAQGNERAIEMKIDAIFYGMYGLSYRNYGHEKNSQVARAMIDNLAGKGRESAIKMKIYGLSQGIYGYEKNPQAARALIENFADNGSEKATIRKIHGPIESIYGYTRNLPNCRIFLS